MRLSGLFLYPVKGLRGIGVRDAAVEACGLAGDRRWMLVDAQGRFLSQRQVPGLARIAARLQPDGLVLGSGRDRLLVARPAPGGERLEVTVWRSRLHAARAGEAADGWLSRQLGRPCRLVFLDDARARPIEPADAHPGDHVSFADGFPVLLTGEGSLASLNAALARPVGMDRFRPNLVVAGAPAWAEDDWQVLRIGEVRFRGPTRCVRCVVTTIDQRSGEKPDPGEPLSTLARLNRRPEGIVFGLNLVPLGTGRVRLGDPIEIVQ